MKLRFPSALFLCWTAAFAACSSNPSENANEGERHANDGGGASVRPEGGDGHDADVELPDGKEGGRRDAGNCVDTATTICDDFDEATIASKWTQHAEGSSLTVGPGGLSAPNALAVTVTDRGVAYVEKSFPFSTKVHCELDMKVVKVPQAGEHRIFSITTKLSNGTDYDIAIEQGGTLRNYYFVARGLAPQDGGYATTQNSLETLPTNSWLHVVFDNDGTKATIRVGSAYSALTGHAEPAGSSRVLKLGVANAVGVYPEAQVLYDNVACTFGN